MQTPETPDPAPPVTDSQSWLDLVFGWLRHEEPVLSALVILAGVALGIWRLFRRAVARRTPPREVRRWQRFADHLESQLRRLDEKEEWRDHRFARLEAEVEAEGGQRSRLFRWRGRRQDGLRREPSLLDALKGSSERLIVLQGDPGSGKSVSLRKVAIDLAREAMHSTRRDQKIPLYINLKEFRPPRRPDAAAVREFVLASLNQANSRDVEQFLEEEFDQGMAEGRWLFLFDSFDEIPDVLSADRVDETVAEYADALFDFLHGMNRSRGVVASREFRGPYGFGWPRFTVQRLTTAQQRELIERTDLPRAAERAVINGIAAAEPPVARLTENPMLLGLLCEHVRETGEFPGSSHTVFETFVASRLRRDAERVERRFGIGPEALRVWEQGRRVDRKWAVESAALADPPTTTHLIESVFATDSPLLHEAAYRQAGRLPELPAPLASHIRRTLVSQAYRGRMLRDWPTITAQVRRLAQPAPWLHIAHLLRRAPIIDALLALPIFAATTVILDATDPLRDALIAVVGPFRSSRCPTSC